jgi:predicted nucleotidyltransferase
MKLQDLPIALDPVRLADIARRYGIRELALFGSVLRQDFGPSSDVDVLVRFQRGSPVKDLIDFIEVKQELEDLIGRPVDLVEPHTLDPRIRETVLQNRLVIYDAA